MKIAWKPYLEVSARWPRQGRHILASYDQREIIVYQAFRPEIADVAVAQQKLRSPFSLSRMSWIKPNFLWMMSRCGWASKPEQTRVLAIHLPRTEFARLLAEAVWSSHRQGGHASEEEWKSAVSRGEVRLQWDPDHAPSGQPLERRAIQLGLRGGILQQYAIAWPLLIEDITTMVREQHRQITLPQDLLVPDERAFPVDSDEIRRKLELS